MFATKAIHFEACNPMNGVFDTLIDAFNRNIACFDDNLDEVNVEITMDWLARYKPNIADMLDRDSIKNYYLQYKYRKTKMYEIQVYLTMLREENDTVSSIMNKLKINPRDVYLKPFIQVHM
jgi:hypothetical protein